MGVNGPLAATLPMFKAIAPFFRSDAACSYNQQRNSHAGVEEEREETVGKSTEQSIKGARGVREVADKTTVKHRMLTQKRHPLFFCMILRAIKPFVGI